MKRLAILLCLLSAATCAQISARDPRWRTNGVGALAGRPATCTANRDVYICNGAGCTTNGEYHYCTAANTYTVASGAIGGPPTGAAGGDLSGTYPNPTVSGIGGTALAGLGTGILKLTKGIPSLGVEGTDFVGGHATLTTASVIPRVASAGVLGPSKLSCTGSPVTCTLYDDTAGTGATTLAVKAGAGQGVSNLQEWKDAAGANLVYVSPGGSVIAVDTVYGANVTTTSSGIIGTSTGTMRVGVDSQYGFSSTASWYGTVDAAIMRTSAGRPQINSGTVGKWGGLDTGSVSMKSLATPGAPTVTPTCGSGCTQTWSYHVQACLADGTTCTDVGAIGSTALQNATLDVTNYNTITCTAVTGATKYNFRRHASGGTPATLGLIGTASTCSLVDNGLTGDGSADPLLNQTGMVTLAGATTPTAASNACVAGNIWWDASYLYVCTATGVIKRAGIAGW